MRKGETIRTVFERVNLDALHFSKMSEADAVKAMIADKITADEDWAKKAYKACTEAVAPKKVNKSTNL